MSFEVSHGRGVMTIICRFAHDCGIDGCSEFERMVVLSLGIRFNRIKRVGQFRARDNKLENPVCHGYWVSEYICDRKFELTC